MTCEQWALADEMVRGLRTYADMLSAADFTDPFEHLLGAWSLFLLVLAWEMLASIVLLTRAGNRRTAFSLVRPLIEYYVRLKFYMIDANSRAKPWRASGELGPAATNITETQAYKDLHNTGEKLLVNMKKMPLDLEGLDEEQRKSFKQMLADAEEYRIQRWSTMLKIVEAAEPVRRNMIDAEYGFSGSYLHGDQLASFEILHLSAETGTPEFTSRFSERRIVTSALLLAFMLMDTIGEACGREYGCRYFGPKIHDLFPDD